MWFNLGYWLNTLKIKLRKLQFSVIISFNYLILKSCYVNAPELILKKNIGINFTFVLSTDEIAYKTQVSIYYCIIIRHY
jgi:hypothetical protein